jgi:hypothetical protein
MYLAQGGALCFMRALRKRSVSTPFEMRDWHLQHDKHEAPAPAPHHLLLLRAACIVMAKGLCFFIASHAHVLMTCLQYFIVSSEGSMIHG